MAGQSKGMYMRRMVLVALAIMASDMVVGQAPVTSISTGLTEIEAVEWSPDGMQIAIGGGSYPCDRAAVNSFDIQIIDIESGDTAQTLTGLSCRVEDMDWSFDGEKLAAANFQELGVTVWDIESGEIVLWDPTGAQGVSSVDWSPTADRLAIGYAANYVFVIDANSSDVLSILSVGGTTVDWNKDGDLLAVSSVHHSSVYIVDLSGQTEELKLTGGEEPNVDVKWSPDSKRIATASRDPSVRIWDVESRELLFSLDHSDFVYEVDWSPDGRMIASACKDGMVRVWDTESGELVEAFTYTGPVDALDWSPDGTKIAFGGRDTSGELPEVVIVDAPEMPEIEATVMP
jgi:WD40 repeat protein